MLSSHAHARRAQPIIVGGGGGVGGGVSSGRRNEAVMKVGKNEYALPYAMCLDLT